MRYLHVTAVRKDLITGQQVIRVETRDEHVTIQPASTSQ